MKLTLLSLPLLIVADIQPFALRKSSEGLYGFTIQTKAKRRHFVTDILSGSQAEKVGLHDGWQITEVNGKAISGLLNEEVADMVTEFDEVILILSDDDLQKLSCKKKT